jgi:predicted dehydrogenase
MKKNNSKMDSKISRRDFIGAAAAAGAFTVVPRYVLGGPGYTPPSEKLNIAGVGVGGQGGGDINAVSGENNIVALCDVDSRKAARTFRRHPQAKKYTDFRVMLEKQKDIDAVIVATPDHNHAIISITAMKMGKHVYCEKPLTHSIYEAREMAKIAKQYKVATQMGNGGQASEGTRLMAEYIMADALGQVHEVHVWTDRPVGWWAQGIDRPKETPAVPDTLDWDLFIGPAPYRPYNPAYHSFAWRGWWDFGTGALGDMGCHAFDPIFRALKLGYPTSVHATCTPVNKETFPLASTVHYQFPDREGMAPVKLTWYDGGIKPRRPDQLEDNRQWGNGGTLFVGNKGSMLGYKLIPESRRIEFGKPPRKLPRSIGHFKEWTEACKGGKPAGANFEFASLVTEVVLLGNIALRPELKDKLTNTTLQWDGTNMKITNLPEANEFLHTESRSGWTL